MKKVILIAVLFCAAESFAAMQAYLSIKGTKQGQFKGKSSPSQADAAFEIKDFSFGIENAVGTPAQGCATKEIHFTATGDGAAVLVQACQTNERIAEMTLDFMNTRHELQNATVRSCQNNRFTIHFDRCASHPTTVVAASLVNPNTTARPANAQIFIDGKPGDRFDLISLQLQGNNTAVLKVRESANGFFQRSAANKKGSSSIAFLRFKFDTVFTTKVQWNSDGTETVTLNYAKYAGPAEGLPQ